MSPIWQPWTSVSDGYSTPGGAVTAVRCRWDDSYSLFISDPNGGVYAIKAVAGYGWEAVPGLVTKPGAPVTAVPSETGVTLFVADVNGEIFTTSGIPYQQWDPWTSVSEGSSTPGAVVTAVPWQDDYVLFISDPNGGVYATKAGAGYGWEAVPGLVTKPGAPITAVWSAAHLTLFVADVNGEIFTTSGIPYQQWDPWTSVSEGDSTPGAVVMAEPWGDSNALFITDPNGGVYAIKAVAGYGWEAVPGLVTLPGAPVSVLSSYSPPTTDVDYQYFLLFVADANGDVYQTSGIPYQSWNPWVRVPGGVTTAGGLITALGEADEFGPITLFAADSDGQIHTTTT